MAQFRSGPLVLALPCSGNGTSSSRGCCKVRRQKGGAGKIYLPTGRLMGLSIPILLAFLSEKPKGKQAIHIHTYTHTHIDT